MNDNTPARSTNSLLCVVDTPRRRLLESLGLDGKVPLRQARINAGLDVPEMKVAA